MLTQRQIFDWVLENYPDAAPRGNFEDYYNSCIAGVSHYFSGTGDRLMLVTYDLNLCRKLLMTRDGMSYEEADEWLDVNDLGAYIGERTPTFLDRPVEGELEEDE